ncbi:hypothetical protein NT6N_06450 [Oceaniferula spumae]|uniref:Uncharacterized protein n=1 Tax=Oceaniferula spumae TaxID=2979115 RepID=A0AAT9FI30_9BACT
MELAMKQDMVFAMNVMKMRPVARLKGGLQWYFDHFTVFPRNEGQADELFAAVRSQLFDHIHAAAGPCFQPIIEVASEFFQRSER